MTPVARQCAVRRLRDQIRVERTKRGARLVQDDAVLSEILSEPGPTHGWFDVLAACVAVRTAKPRFLMLGFAGGGMVAPLRAMGFDARVEAVDFSTDGESLFRELSASWSGPVTVHRSDASTWLRHSKTFFDTILEDLSVPTPEGVLKPEASFDELPGLIVSRLASDGWAAFNLLPHPKVGWAEHLRRITEPFAEALLILDDEFENRIVVASDELPAAGILARSLRRCLEGIGSERWRELRVRSVKRIQGSE